VLVTAGPTREPLDPVRFLGNRSSGRMGHAVAAALRNQGAEVVVVSGPVALPAPTGVEVVRIETALEMHAAVMARVDGIDIFVGCAAVADYRPAVAAGQKIKKTGKPLEVRLVPNPDILAAVAALPNPPFTLGFAAETEGLQQHAEAKLQRKGVHMLAANLVSDPGIGFDSNDNELTVVWSGGGCRLERKSKDEIAAELVAILVERYRASIGAEDSG
jgi:phosphopantothenoylcysteine decarboxylase/phosphopantothenate--cysteine ligase